MSFKGLILFLALVTILFVRVDTCSNFGTELYKEEFCEIILNLSHRLETTYHSKTDFPAKALVAISLCGVEPFTNLSASH